MQFGFFMLIVFPWDIEVIVFQGDIIFGVFVQICIVETALVIFRRTYLRYESLVYVFFSHIWLIVRRFEKPQEELVDNLKK